MIDFELVEDPADNLQAATAPAVVATTPAAEAATPAAPAEAPKAEAPADPLVALASRVDALASLLKPAEAPAAAPKAEVEVPVIDPAEFYLDPQAAVTKAVTQAMNQAAVASQAAAASAAQAQADLRAAHADADAVFADAGFKAFATSDPVAGRLLAEAKRTSDGKLAASVLTLYKATKAATPVVSGATATGADLATNVDGASGSSIPVPQAPKFTREQLSKMSTDEYESRNGEILAAYAAGLVR